MTPCPPDTVLVVGRSRVFAALVMASASLLNPFMPPDGGLNLLLQRQYLMAPLLWSSVWPATDR